MNIKGKIGKFGQQIAGQFLQKRGYEILAENFHSRKGEIDLVVEKDGQLVFVEVKTRLSDKFGLPEEIARTALEHHQDKPETLEGVIVKTADAISGARPGARKDTYEQYVQRLEDLENTAKDITGVEKVYAIQAGRELRVFVEPSTVDDWNAKKIAREVANKIEEELKYPGEIKVCVIREMRVEEYAR